jgi:hypothetical protein
MITFPKAKNDQFHEGHSSFFRFFFIMFAVFSPLLHQEPMQVDPPAPEPMEVDMVQDHSTSNGPSQKRKQPTVTREPVVKKEEK